MPSKVRKKLDKLRRRFLWFEGSSVKKKYHLVSWKIICNNKEQGGLGIKDLDLMNKALLGKWLWRYQDPQVKGLSKEIIHFRYSKRKSLIGLSPFWSGVCKDRTTFELGVSKILGNGKRIYFWSDRWIGEISLKAAFPELFELAIEQQIRVDKVFHYNSINLHFIRQITGSLRLNYVELYSLLYCKYN